MGDEVYSMLVPTPGERWRLEPMDAGEARWKHMGKTINSSISPLARFGYEHDYGSPTELTLENSSVFGELVQAVSPPQPWHVGKDRHPGQEQFPGQLPALRKSGTLEGGPGAR